MLNPMWTETERNDKHISNCGSWERRFGLAPWDSRTITCFQALLSHEQCGLLASHSSWKCSEHILQHHMLVFSSASLALFGCPVLLFLPLSSRSEWMKILIHNLYLVWAPCSEFNSNSWHCMQTFRPWSISVYPHCWGGQTERSAAYIWCQVFVFICFHRSERLCAALNTMNFTSWMSADRVSCNVLNELHARMRLSQRWVNVFYKTVEENSPSSVLNFPKVRAVTVCLFPLVCHLPVC